MEFFSEEQKTLFGQHLADGIKQLNLNIDEEKQELLLIYLEQLAKWNKAYNLIRHQRTRTYVVPSFARQSKCSTFH